MKNEILLKKLFRLSAWTDENFERHEMLQALIEDVKAEMRMETAKASGKGNLMKLVENIFKMVKGTQYEENLQYAHTCEDGHQYVCDSFRILKFAVPLPLPEAPAKSKVALNKVFDANVKKVILSPQTLVLPDLVSLKLFVKIKRIQKEEPRFDFGFGLPVVDARLLLSIMEAFPDVDAKCSSEFYSFSGFNSSVIVWENANGDVAALLPLRPKDDVERERTVV